MSNMYPMQQQSVDYEPLGNKDPNFMQWFLKGSEDDIDDLANMWRGYSRDFKGQYRPTQLSDKYRIMNETGIKWCTQTIRSLTGRTHQNSNYNEDHMNFRMRSAYRIVYWGLVAQYDVFDMKKVHVQGVAEEMLGLIHATLLGSRGNGVRDLLTKTHQVSEIRTMNPDDKRGFLSALGGLFKRPTPPQQQQMYEG